MDPLRSIIIEGVDRLGKDTLINGLMNKFGFMQRLHYQKPEHLQVYHEKALFDNKFLAPGRLKEVALQTYQQQSFIDMFHMLSSPARLVLNRAHLGETVYAPRYRNYDGSYVFHLEETVGKASLDTTLLVLLHTSDFSFIQDDGESFDFEQKEEEQMDFIRAFERSAYTHKVMVDVAGEGAFVWSHMILGAVAHAFERIQGQQHTLWNVSFSFDGETGDWNRNISAQPHPRLLVS